jgi:hypothetical protein
MLQRIKNCFGFDESEKSDNTVEIDESYIGGENKNRSIGTSLRFNEMLSNSEYRLTYKSLING